MSEKYKKQAILFINMASGFGGGEFQTEQLMRTLKNYQVYFFGKKSGKFIPYLKQNLPHIHILNFWQMLKLVFTTNSLVIHAQDGRGAHIAGTLKRLSGKPTIITRHVAFPFKHKSSLYAYRQANMLIGVSKKITENLLSINPNTQTIYGCIKKLKEDNQFEQCYFSGQKNKLRIAHIANLQQVKNFPLTIALARNNPNIDFYLVGSGELEQELRQQAADLNNVIFIPFTEYVGSVFKHIDLQIVPSHSEGLGATILEGYQYTVPTIANAVGGIPEIIEDKQTGFLVHENILENYQSILDKLIQEPDLLIVLKNNIQQYMKCNDFSADRMGEEYHQIYQRLLND